MQAALPRYIVGEISTKGCHGRDRQAEAAERLIVSGIVQHQRGEDSLAIHVVAASALNLLRELIAAEGEPYQMRVLHEGIFLAAAARIEERPTQLPDHPVIEAILEKVMAAILSGELRDAGQIEIGLDRPAVVALLDHVYRPYNFLKHADRDPLDTLDESDVDPASTLIHAMAAYGCVSPGMQWPDSIIPFLEQHGLAEPRQSA